MAASSTANAPSLTISPLLGLILGVIITVSIGIFAFFDNYLSLDLFVAFLATYGAAGAALGAYLILQGNTNPSWLKFLILIVASSVAYGLSTLVHVDLTFVNAGLLATFIIGLSSFALEELQAYAPNLPTKIVNDGTLIIGGIVVIAEAVKNAAPGSIVSVQTLLAVIIPAIFVYFIQVATHAPPPAPMPTPTPSSP